MKRRPSLLSALIILISLLLVPAKLFAADSLKPVRVGYFDLRNCMEGAEDGARKYGYVHDVLGEIAAFSKWQVEYVCDDLSTLLDMLANGEIDVIPCISYNEERASKMLFSDESIVDENYNIYARREQHNTSLPKNAHELNGASVATVRGAFENDLLDAWERENNIKTVRVYCDSFEEAWQKVLDGSADYALNLDYTAPGNQYVPLFKLGSCGTYFAVEKSRMDILSDINSAIIHINNVSPFLFSQLEEEYLNRGADAIQLSDDEKNWLEKHPTIRVGAFSNDYPFSFINEEGNKVGVYKDLTSMIFESVGLEADYEWILFDTIQQAHAALNNGEIDVFCEDYHDYDTAETNGVIISNPINEVTMGVMSVEGQGTVPNKKIAVANTRLGEFFAKEIYPDAELVLCASVPECVEKVASGEVG